MPTSYPELYFPVFVQVVLAVVIAAALVVLSTLLGKHVRDRAKDMPYESGMNPIGTARERFSVKYYLVAIVFILFDIEAVFLYPWAVVYRELKMFAFVEMLLFIILIAIGLYADLQARSARKLGAYARRLTTQSFKDLVEVSIKVTSGVNARRARIGMLALTNESIPFTAAYRPKYNWLDNLSPGTGGMGVP